VSDEIGGKIDGMRPGRGRYVANDKGEVVQESGLALPEHVVDAPAQPSGVLADPPPVMGPSRVGELLMVDIRVAKAVPPGSRLYAICQSLSERNYAGKVESTLVIDLLEVGAEDRRFLLNRANWPVPTK